MTRAPSPTGAPVVYTTGAGTGFLRPSGGGDDLNASDSFEAPQGISIVLRKGSQLRVRAKASPPHTKPGQSVRFEAIVERAGSGESLAYSWYFDDGSSAGGVTARHRFAKPGSYDVVVGVTTNGDEVGASDVVTVQVGPAPAGPDRKGGGRNKAEDAPDHGAAEGPDHGPGGDTAGGGAAPTTGAPASPAGSTEPAGEKSRFETHAQRGKGTTRSAPADRVVGELLSAPAEPASRPLQPAAASARRGRLEGSSGGGVPAAAWGLLATLGLLGAGALVEARQLGPGLRARLWRGGAA